MSGVIVVIGPGLISQAMARRVGVGPDGGFITGSGIPMDGGVTAAYGYGGLAEVRK
jgi:hypothetical protein